MSDERIRTNVGTTERQDRAMEDREVTQDREFNEADRLALLRASLHQDHLPNLPEIPGFHVCWLTTNSVTDTIAGRLAKGYVLLTEADVKGYKVDSVKSGNYKGCIMVNEMIAAKIPLDLFKFDMKFHHHIRPNEEEEKLKNPISEMREKAAAYGIRVAEGEEAESWRK